MKTASLTCAALALALATLSAHAETLRCGTGYIVKAGDNKADVLQNFSQNAQSKAQDALVASKNYVRENPVPVIVGALLLGAGIGYLLSQREKEEKDTAQAARDLLIGLVVVAVPRAGRQIEFRRDMPSGIREPGIFAVERRQGYDEDASDRWHTLARSCVDAEQTLRKPVLLVGVEAPDRPFERLNATGGETQFLRKAPLRQCLVEARTKRRVEH